MENIVNINYLLRVISERFHQFKFFRNKDKIFAGVTKSLFEDNITFKESFNESHEGLKKNT